MYILVIWKILTDEQQYVLEQAYQRILAAFNFDDHDLIDLMAKQIDI